MPTTTTGAEFELSAGDRDRYLEELFALHDTLHPGQHLCFCGSDRELVDGVHTLREQLHQQPEHHTERHTERQDEDDEIGG